MNTSRDEGSKITPEPAFKASIDLLIWAIIVIQIIVAVYGFVVLPDTVPIHWGINGQANGYGPKWVGTFLFPFISIGIYILIRGLLAAGPRLGGRENLAANLQIVKLVLAGLTLFMLIIQLSALVQSLGIGFDMTLIVMLALSVLFIFLGNYMGKMRRNFWMGIRTPWSLTNAVVWERTHRLGGWLFVAVGLIGVICSFIPLLRIWGIIVPSIAVSIFLYVYSYICYQQQMQIGQEPLSPPFDKDNL
ncbi:MAG TPA: SdpI family protein [Ktedonobacteraceae bacterium]|nr:SdpI family protein [Ktedonobacteraceae bacterium]